MTLAEYLAENNLSARQFAEISGVSEATIKRIKRSGCAGSPSVAQRVIQACEGVVTAQDLFPFKAINGSAK
jgi:transcriptional regulator with XRE-family HTH domain